MVYEWFHFVLPVIIALAAAATVYLRYRKASVAVWGFVGSLFVDAPMILLAPLGATSLFNVSLITHSLGIIIFPIILVIIDILLIEFRLLKYLKPVYGLLPSTLKTAVRIEMQVEKLQNYHAIPGPERIQSVFVAGVLAGAVNLIISGVLFYFGFVPIL